MKETIYSLSVWEDIVTWFHWDWWSKTICLLIHGLASRPHMALNRWFCCELEKNNIDSLRLDLYDVWKRSLGKRWFTSQIKEIEAVIENLKDSYEKIFLVWHSVWGLLSFLVDHTHITWILWWDASIPWVYKFQDHVDDMWEYWYKTGWLFEFLVSRTYVDEIVQVSDDYMKNISVPYLTLFSSQCDYYCEYRKKTAEMSSDQKIALIEWSSHSFQEYGKQEEVFKRSIEWLVSKL